MTRTYARAPSVDLVHAVLTWSHACLSYPPFFPNTPLMLTSSSSEHPTPQRANLQGPAASSIVPKSAREASMVPNQPCHSPIPGVVQLYTYGASALHLPYISLLGYLTSRLPCGPSSCRYWLSFYGLPLQRSKGEERASEGNQFTKTQPLSEGFTCPKYQVYTPNHDCGSKYNKHGYSILGYLGPHLGST